MGGHVAAGFSDLLAVRFYRIILLRYMRAIEVNIGGDVARRDYRMGR